MRIDIKPKHYVGIGIGTIIIIIDFILFFNFTTNFGPKVWYFNPILVIGGLAGTIFFILDFLETTQKQKELELKFLEFVRSLVENVRSGVTITQAILHVANINFGSLTPHVQKLAHQIEWGYPIKTALGIFANDTRNDVIKRSIAIVIEAEKSGGDIGSVLESVAESVVQIKQVKEERKTNASAQTIQGYIIYVVFIGVMVMLQVFLIPKISALTLDVNSGIGSGSSGVAAPSKVDFGPIFTTMILIQGLFAGLMIGKFAEGEYKEGIKHALIMMIGGYLITATLTGIFTAAPAAIVLLINNKLIKIKEEK